MHMHFYELETVNAHHEPERKLTFRERSLREAVKTAERFGMHPGEGIVKAWEDGLPIEALETKAFGECPKCGALHEDGEGKTLHTHFVDYMNDVGGSGFRDFICTGCGTLLREDIST